jgi:hypothetical protein
MKDFCSLLNWGGKLMKEELFKYLEEDFPDLTNDIHVRYELGEPFENGSDERITQVNYRVISIFEDLFDKDDFIYVYIIDWEENTDVMFGDTTPQYIYELIDNKRLEEVIMYEPDEVIDEEGNTQNANNEYKVRLSYGRLSTIPYKEILSGKANYEQGREPSIGQRVYFINTQKDIVFNMYDDRGCIVFSNSADKLRYIYDKYNNWIVEYWRECIDEIFE